MRKYPTNVIDKSIEELDILLVDIADDAESSVGDEELHKALKSQGALARFSRGDKIFGSSLNTVKRRSAMVLTRGFLQLDEHRISALSAIEVAAQKEGRAGKRTKAAVQEGLRDAEEQLDKTREDLLVLTAALGDAIRYGRICASASQNGAAAVQYEKHIQELLARFSRAATLLRKHGNGGNHA
jgi:hypothetical protein